MRPPVQIFLFVLVLSGPPALAQNAAMPPANPIQTVLQLDANGDQTLERDEVPEAGQAAFDRLLTLGDLNKNGRLEADELRALVGKVQSWAGAGAARFKAMDKDGNGKLGKDEFQGPNPLFGQIDKDGDGFLVMEEMRAFAAAGGQARFERFQGMDRDRDGKVSRDEFTGPKPRFALLDADGDGFVTLDEFLIAPALGDNGPAPKKAAAPNAQRLRSMDKDGDGKVSRAEFTGTPRMFERLDINKDGFLSADDLLNRRPAKNVAKP
jgi:Ca2+-binding EF-hand superfamily protein